MKKFVSVFLFVAGLFCVQAMAESYGADYWQKSYFVQGGFNAAFSHGDLNKQSISAKDTVGDKMKIYKPDLGFIPSPELTLGVNIRFFTLAVDFQYSSLSQNLADLEDSDESDVTVWRFGFEFLYNFNWPEDIQVGLGLGYSFTTLYAGNSAYLDDEIYRSQLMGSGVAFIANMHYYFTNHIAIVPSVKIYENWFKNVYTGPSELCDLDPYLWQTFYTASIALQYQF